MQRVFLFVFADISVNTNKHQPLSVPTYRFHSTFLPPLSYPTCLQKKPVSLQVSCCFSPRNKPNKSFERDYCRTSVDVLPVASRCECPFPFFTVDYGLPEIWKETHHTAWLKIWFGIFTDYPPKSLLTIDRCPSIFFCFLF
jgi:hypothetical protein